MGFINDWYRVPDALTGVGGAKSHTRQKDSTAVEFAAVLMIIVFVTSYLLPKMFMERNFTNSVDEVWCCLWRESVSASLSTRLVLVCRICIIYVRTMRPTPAVHWSYVLYGGATSTGRWQLFRFPYRFQYRLPSGSPALLLHPPR